MSAITPAIAGVAADVPPISPVVGSAVVVADVVKHAVPQSETANEIGTAKGTRYRQRSDTSGISAQAVAWDAADHASLPGHLPYPREQLARIWVRYGRRSGAVDGAIARASAASSRVHKVQEALLAGAIEGDLFGRDLHRHLPVRREVVLS